VILIAGCATGQSASKGAAGAVRLTAGCESAAASGEGWAAVRSAFEHAGLLGFSLAVRGAAEGAFWGAVTGGSAGDGAWIGAAAGAGLGIIIGAGAGISRGLDAHRAHRATYESCVTAPVARQDVTPPGAPGEEHSQSSTEVLPAMEAVATPIDSASLGQPDR
jgi:hypothetical protein